MAPASMTVALRQALAILVLPVTVVVIIPVWIAGAAGTRIGMPGSAVEWALSLLGVPVLILGGLLFAASVKRFGSEGKGTLAPWDPPSNLVVRGPYAHVRNPMISGVILMLLAEALLLGSLPHLQWAGLFFVINAVYIPLLEEPLLATKFGEEYEEYRSAVPRLIPCVRPWPPPDGVD